MTAFIIGERAGGRSDPRSPERVVRCGEALVTALFISPTSLSAIHGFEIVNRKEQGQTPLDISCERRLSLKTKQCFAVNYLISLKSY
jgi:hypothetical protein